MGYMGQYDDLLLAVAMAAWLGERAVAWEAPTVVTNPAGGETRGWASRLFGRG
jgi:hypothetical protein